jgi:Domain of unknown function (DUF4304)
MTTSGSSSEVATIVGELLKSNHYRKKDKGNWYARGDGTIVVVNLQHSQWGGGVKYVNIGVAIVELLPAGRRDWIPPVHRCGVYCRLELYHGDPSRPQETCFNDDLPLPITERRALIEAAFFDTFATAAAPPSLKDIASRFRSGGMDYWFTTPEAKALLLDYPC